MNANHESPAGADKDCALFLFAEPTREELIESARRMRERCDEDSSLEELALFLFENLQVHPERLAIIASDIPDLEKKTDPGHRKARCRQSENQRYQRHLPPRHSLGNLQ